MVSWVIFSSCRGMSSRAFVKWLLLSAPNGIFYPIQTNHAGKKKLKSSTESLKDLYDCGEMHLLQAPAYAINTSYGTRRNRQNKNPLSIKNISKHQGETSLTYSTATKPYSFSCCSINGSVRAELIYNPVDQWH